MTYVSLRIHSSVYNTEFRLRVNRRRILVGIMAWRRAKGVLEFSHGQPKSMGRGEWMEARRVGEIHNSNSNLEMKHDQMVRFGAENDAVTSHAHHAATIPLI